MSTSTNKKEAERIAKEVYPDNLLQAIFSESMYQRYKKDPPPDALEVIDKILKRLTPREEAFISHRYKDLEIYKTIAQRYKITTAKVKTVLARAVNKLSRPFPTKEIFYGIRDRESRKALMDAEADIYEIEKLMKKAEFYPIRDPYQLLDQFMTRFIEEHEYINNTSKQDKLCYWELRSLHDHNIFTVEDLLSVSRSDLQSLINCDVRTILRLYDNLHEKRIHLLAEQKAKATPKTIEGLSEYFNWYYTRVK